ncbi:MAG: ATP-binding protein [Verrucomicrobiota bacterium]
MSVLQVLYLEDDANDALLLRHALKSGGLDAEVGWVSNAREFAAALERGGVDVVLADNSLPGFDGLAALRTLRSKWPHVPCICLSGALEPKMMALAREAGIVEFVLKDDLSKLPAVIRRVLTMTDLKQHTTQLSSQDRAMARLVQAVQELSLARSLDAVMAVVRRAARELTGADGATFVLRDGSKCHYADEDAIAPLWKGKRFPMSACISGWAMLNRQAAVIEDIYADARIPADAYRPTFVKSLAMVPIRVADPIGAIGNYWAHRHQPTQAEVELLQALANTTAVAMENVQIYADLEHRVADRTLQLEAANQELEAFSYSVAHDLRAPLRAINGFSEMMEEECAANLDAAGAEYLKRIRGEARRMGVLIDDLLKLSRLARAEMNREKIDLSEMARHFGSTLQAAARDRRVDFQVQDGLVAEGDPVLVGVVLENLLSNAWKYSSKRDVARVEFGAQVQADGSTAYYVRDNGAGFDMNYVHKLFTPFQRLHRQDEFPGHGIGLATVARIIHRHGGKLRAEGEVDKGAAFYFTLCPPPTQ